MDIVQLLFGFQGRINRAKYWIAVVIYIAAVLVAGVIGVGLGFGAFFLLIAVVIYIPILISGIAVGIKRLHDRDKSGWWLLVFFLLPAVLSWLATSMSSIGWLLSLASLALSIWGLVELGILRGTSGPNQYGADPLTA